MVSAEWMGLQMLGPAGHKGQGARRGVSAVPDVPDRLVPNERTGETRIVPVGIDPGWQRNPGQLRLQAMEATLRQKLEDLPEAARKVALRDIATSWRVMRIMEGAPGRAPVGLLPTELATATGVSDRMIWVNNATFEHVVGDHLANSADAAFRKALMAVIAGIGDARLAALEERPDGNVTLRVLIPFDKFFHVAESARKKKADRPTALVLWFDDAMRVRTIMPTTVARFAKDAAERGDKVIDLDKD